MPTQLYNRETGQAIGDVTDAQLDILRELLEEEGADDPDYFVSPEVVDYLLDNGADAALIKLLRDAVGDTEGLEIGWRKT